MPRLEGTRTNMVPYLLGLIVVAIAVLLVIELAGVIDVIDGFGSN